MDPKLHVKKICSIYVEKYQQVLIQNGLKINGQIILNRMHLIGYIIKKGGSILIIDQ